MASDKPDRWMEALGVAMALAEYMPHLTADERLELASRIFAGYCRECGNEMPEGGCCCMRDD